MKRIKFLLSVPLLAGVIMLHSFSPKAGQTAKAGQAIKPAMILNYAWYEPDGTFVAWSTLANAEIVSGDDTDPTGGTLALEGYTGGDFGEPPSGTLVYKLYSHP